MVLGGAGFGHVRFFLAALGIAFAGVCGGEMDRLALPYLWRNANGAGAAGWKWLGSVASKSFTHDCRGRERALFRLFGSSVDVAFTPHPLGQIHEKVR